MSEVKRADVRTLTSGDLQVNLSAAMIDLQQASQAMQQLAFMKQSQKMVKDPPEMAQVAAAAEEAKHRVHVLKLEVDRRNKAVDEARSAEAELEAEVMPRFLDYLREHPGWGSLHLVLEEGNFEDSHVQACIDHAEDEGDDAGAELARILLDKMTPEQRSVFRDRAVLPEKADQDSKFAQAIMGGGAN